MQAQNGCNEDLDLIAQFEEDARNAISVQADLLSSILTHNSCSAYLQQHGITGGGLSDAASFKSQVPIVDYDDLQPLIQRIADGDSSPILTASPITSMLLSSGTSSGQSRLIPATSESRQILLKRFTLSDAILRRDLSIKSAGKALCFIYAGKLLTTKGGLKAGSSSTLHLRGKTHLDRLPQWTSPLEVILGPNMRQSMYCHLLCGLIQATEVNVISSFLAYGITEAFRCLENVWEELCSDIATGKLSGKITDDSVRSAVSKSLHPNPELAEKVHAECQRGWSGIIKRLWPNVIYIHTIVTGAMEPYVRYLKNYAGDIAIVSGDYGSSECTIGINLRPKSPPEEVTFTLFPYAAYFEFLPVDQDKHLPANLAELDVGKEYELIVTTVSGLYRYRLGDVIRVTGYYHSLPQFCFSWRRDVMLSINTDKTDEGELCKVIKHVSKRLSLENMELVDFIAYADHTSRPGNYTIFWELGRNNLLNATILQQCCNDLDGSFNDPYQRGRAAGTIGALKLCIVKENTFFDIMLASLESGASPSQYKTPRCTNSVHLLNILRGSVLKVYTSSQY